jgi:hypothetical protein
MNKKQGCRLPVGVIVHYCADMGRFGYASYITLEETMILRGGTYMVELVGIEPTTSSLRTMRSPS